MKELEQGISDFKGFVQSNYKTYVPMQIAEAIKLLDSQAQKIAELEKEPKLHCVICSRCKGDNSSSWCSVNGLQIDDVMKCPTWCIERGINKEEVKK